MPIILSGGSGSGGSGVTYTAQDIINGTSQDIRKQFGTTGSDATILLDYVDRIQKEVLRKTKWRFLLQAPVQFITQVGVTDYWIGTLGGNGSSAYDTGLNLTNVYRLDDDSVQDRTNNLPLSRVDIPHPPNSASFHFQDGQSRLLRPEAFSHETYGSLIRLYPAPNNQNNYQPQPESPICSTTAGGALPARTYYVRYSIVDSAGLESNASGTATVVFVPANKLLVVNNPALPSFKSADGVAYNSYKVYASSVSGSEVVQNGGTAIASGSSFTESVGGLSTGTTPYPTVNNLTTMKGYLIEFSYYSQRLPLTTTAQSLQVPDDYKDILIAGTNTLAFQLLQKPQDYQFWHARYQDGLKQMTRDKQQFTDDFIRPDPTSQLFLPTTGVLGY